MKKHYVVKETNGNEIIFSQKKLAQYFVSNVYHDPKAEIIAILPETNDDFNSIKYKFNDFNQMKNKFIDPYIEGPFVYHTTFILPDWETVFIGYSMDLTDERDIVFSQAPETFTVSSLADTYNDAQRVAKISITNAIAHGPFHNDYTKPGYIKCYVDSVDNPPHDDSCIPVKSKEKVIKKIKDDIKAFDKPQSRPIVTKSSVIGQCPYCGESLTSGHVCLYWESQVKSIPVIQTKWVETVRELLNYIIENPNVTADQLQEYVVPIGPRIQDILLDVVKARLCSTVYLKSEDGLTWTRVYSDDKKLGS